MPCLVQLGTSRNDSIFVCSRLMMLLTGCKQPQIYRFQETLLSRSYLCNEIWVTNVRSPSVLPTPWFIFQPNT